MRRLFVLLVVFGTLLAMPLAAANAQTERFEIDVHVSVSFVGVDDAGCELSVGTYDTLFDGVVIEFGDVSLTSCLNEDGSRARYFVTYVDAVNGNVGTTLGKATLTDADFDAGVFSYSLHETITSSTAGVTGNARGSGTVTLTETGYDIDYWLHAIIAL